MGRSALNGGELGGERRRHGGAADAGAVEVLDGDERSLDARRLVCVRAASGEADLHRGATKSSISKQSSTKRHKGRTC